MNEPEDTTIYKVVMNHEEQYSMWPADQENPPGWIDAGKQGTKQECLGYVEEVWTDMRPLSLREQMADSPGRPGTTHRTDRADRGGTSDAAAAGQ